MNIPILVTILILAFIVLAFFVFSETVKTPEKFIIFLDGDTITSVEMYDPSGTLLFNTVYSEKGDAKSIKVNNCCAFVMSWENDKIVSVGPFATGCDGTGSIVNTTFGKKTTDFQIYTNTDQIKRVVRSTK